MTDLATRIGWALDEDIGPGDLTTEATIPATARASARIVAKEALVVSGQEAARVVFDVLRRRHDVFLNVHPEVEDGTQVEPGTVLATIQGDARALLKGERVALNLMMRMCGVATHVRRFVDACGDVPFRVVDTRKTTPMWRDLEKAAVRHGGAANHRFGLFDGVLIKENHIAAAGGVGVAVAAARAAVHHLIRVQVEVETLDELDVALAAGADAVLLDHFSVEQTREAVARVRRAAPYAWVEASGNMTPEAVAARADTGIDAVSAGALIHQATWSDLSLRLSLANG